MLCTIFGVVMASQVKESELDFSHEMKVKSRFRLTREKLAKKKLSN